MVSVKKILAVISKLIQPDKCQGKVQAQLDNGFRYSRDQEGVTFGFKYIEKYLVIILKRPQNPTNLHGALLMSVFKQATGFHWKGTTHMYMV